MFHVYIIGSKGIPARYGGFETFVEELTGRKTDPDVMYHVACLMEAEDPEHNGAKCYGVRVPEIGSAKAILYDRRAFLVACKDIKRHGERSVILCLACRLGPFFAGLKRRAKRLGVPVYVNPDGHEWLRSKWSPMVRKYWKYSEGRMVKRADLCVCDAVEMERYICEEYASFHPKTVYLSYGADPAPAISEEAKKRYAGWLQAQGVKEYGYYLIVARFVPENNFLVMLSEFTEADTDKALCILTDYEGKPLYRELMQETQFDADDRIRFCGTVYDKELLALIRKGAFAYIHGHEVGGTNPSLLEAMAATGVNVLLDVAFNREVGGESCLYFTKEPGNLAVVLDMLELMPEEDRRRLETEAKKRIEERYSWDKIVREYEDLWRKVK